MQPGTTGDILDNRQEHLHSFAIVREAMAWLDRTLPLAAHFPPGEIFRSPHHLWITDRDVWRLHAAGVRVVPWTVNDRADWRRLLRAGVDGIITDDPAALIAFLRARKRR